MRSNILHHLAINDLRVHKKDSILSIITIFIVAVIVMFINLMTPVLQLNKYLEYQSQYGTYDYYGSFDTIEELKQSKLKLDNKDIPYNDSRLSHCIVYSSGTTLLNDRMNSIQGEQSILSISLKEGKMPVQESEVAVKKSVLYKWGYQEQLNKNVEFSYTMNEKPYLKQFKLVGILKENSDTDIVVSKLDYDSITLYVDKNNTDALIRNQDHHFSSSMSEELINKFDNNQFSILSVMIEVIILAISFALLSGLTLSSFEKKERDYTLLRSIGITKRQMYYIIFVQVLILSIIPILLSMGVIYIISLLLPVIVTWPIPITYPTGNIIWSSLNVFAVACVSYFIPAKNACKRAISGSFDSQEFQYFYYRYKTLHRFNPFYLGWRQLVSMKKKMFVKILFMFIIILCSMKVIGSYTIFSQLSRNNLERDLAKEINLECVPLDVDKSVSKEDFEFITPYVNQIDFYSYVEEEQLAKMGHDTYYPRLYCLNDAMKNKYNIDDMKDDEIIVSQYYLDTISYQKDEYLESDKFTFLNKDYKIAKIIDSEYERIAIVNKNVYSQYGNINEYQRVNITYDSISKKTQSFIKDYQSMALVKEKYYLSDSYTDTLYYNKESLESDFSIDSINMTVLLIITGIAIIYIYQFSFELLKQKEDIGTLQLLGLQKREIRNIYFYKSLIVGGIGMILGILYYYLECYDLLKKMNSEYILSNPTTIAIHVIISLIIITIIICISLIPLRYILKSDGLENKNTRE
ncbi:MAG: FtsX-like permease family protein [Coprobacillus sp.]